MPRPTNTDERRAQITQGLRRVMAKKGYEGASVADIAKAAELTPGLVHYHFKDKLEILTALAEHISEVTLESLRGVVGHSRGPVAALDAVIDFYLGLGASADAELLACWIALSGEALRHKPVGRAFEATLAGVHGVIRDLLDEGVRQKLFSRELDPDAVAAALVATIQGYFVLAGTARSLIPKGSAARTVKRMLRGMLGGKP